ncbi:hypothetical protein [Lentimicrobium sp. S6]|uniref:hypothetical protein n=1 Tax=Lentimicrobium sp. S6 TaxID=2735872 RepID=UPI001551F48F|nr:hypothetical protein [Lentimicrobium sp. S6]NPD47612.1 hypothetical protein [Lentimicrobium sp. S6]
MSILELDKDKLKRDLKIGENQIKEYVDKFIEFNKWESKHISSIDEWELINVGDKDVCRLLNTSPTSYNEGTDTYSYKGKLVSVFTGDQYEIEFGYYDQFEVLAIIE